MHRRKIVIVMGAVVALLSLLFLVAACGGDDDGDADPTATEVPAEDPTATEPTEPADEPEPTDSAEPDPTDEPAAAETSVDVGLTEFVVEPSVDSVPAGAVTFNVSSDGAIFHNLRVVATDLDPDGLPTDDATFGVDEAQVDIVGSTADLDPGDTEELTALRRAGESLSP